MVVRVLIIVCCFRLTRTLSNAIDLSCDIPMIWSNYGTLLAPLTKNQLCFDQLPEITASLKEEDKAKEFVAEVVLKCAALFVSF